jgi:hypothetical protein
MRCPRCDFENPDTSIYCEQCGAIQNVSQYVSDQTIYKPTPPPLLNGHGLLKPAPPPPLNGHDVLKPPPPTLEDTTMQSQILTEQKITAHRTVNIFSSILYFTGLIIAALGVMEAIAAFGTSTHISSIALLAAIALIIAGMMFFFMRLRQRHTLLRWWQRILWIFAASAGAFFLLIISTGILLPNPNASYIFTSYVIIAYGLVWAAIAVL